MAVASHFPPFRSNTVIPSTGNSSRKPIPFSASSAFVDAPSGMSRFATVDFRRKAEPFRRDGISNRLRDVGCRILFWKAERRDERDVDRSPVSRFAAVGFAHVALAILKHKRYVFWKQHADKMRLLGKSVSLYFFVRQFSADTAANLCGEKALFPCFFNAERISSLTPCQNPLRARKSRHRTAFFSGSRFPNRCLL